MDLNAFYWKDKLIIDCKLICINILLKLLSLDLDHLPTPRPYQVLPQPPQNHTYGQYIKKKTQCRLIDINV